MQKKTESKTFGLIVHSKRLLLYCVNRNLCALFVISLIFYLAVNLRIESVVTADANIVAGMNMCSSLLVENVACKHKLAVSLLGAKALGHAVSAVFGGTHTFFMSK